jgi:hypothetical protein
LLNVTSRLLHVLNGTATSDTLERSSVRGTYVAYADVLHDGPVPAGLGDEQMRAVRARFVADCGWATYESALNRGTAWDAALANSSNHDEVVFWFEHDLFDQLLLIRHLDWFSRRDVRPTKLSLICIGAFPGVHPFHGLGQLSADQLESLLDTRREVTPNQMALARRAWSAFTSSDPRDIDHLLETDTTALPFLEGALRRHLQEFPAASNGLSRTERQILEVLDSSGPLPPDLLFRATQRLEERVYMGDTSFWVRVSELATAPSALVSLRRLVDRTGRLPDGEAAITPFGRDVLRDRTDRIEVKGIDRWLGGVHLRTPGEIWRGNGKSVIQSR